ncbi:MAG: hypothetical protein ACR2P3_11835, partial [Geminicoccaceae bacterium]
AGGQYPGKISRASVDFMFALDRGALTFAEQKEWRSLLEESVALHLCAPIEAGYRMNGAPNDDIQARLTALLDVGYPSGEVERLRNGILSVTARLSTAPLPSF